MENNYSVYQHITPDGMYYFGATSNIKQRWSNNGERYKETSLYPYIEKFGWDNIQHIVLFKDQTKENALWIENFLIETAREDGVCINKQRSGLVSKEEGYQQQKSKQYYEQNKDKIREYKEQNKDKIREYQREYQEQNKDKIREQKKQYYEQNKDKKREYDQQRYQKNRDEILEQKREYYEQNKDKRKDYLEQNKDKIKEQLKQYKEKNRDKIREYNREYYKRKKLEKQLKEVQTTLF